jgi:hypothetical protein
MDNCKDCKDCVTAAKLGHVECMRDLVDSGQKMGGTIYVHAVVNKQLRCLKYIHTVCDEIPPDICSLAAGVGSSSCIRYLRRNGCTWDHEECTAAAKGGHYGLLIYLHTHGSKWDSDTCLAAAESGNLRCLKYARNHGCPWVWDDVYFASIRNGHKDCVNYVVERRWLESMKTARDVMCC